MGTAEVTAKPSLSRLRAATAQFEAIHRRGMAALQSRDYAGLGDAIVGERRLIDQQLSRAKRAVAAGSKVLSKKIPGD